MPAVEKKIKQSNHKDILNRDISTQKKISNNNKSKEKDIIRQNRNNNKHKKVFSEIQKRFQ